MNKFKKRLIELEKAHSEYLKTKNEYTKNIYDFSNWCVNFCKNRNLNDETVLYSTKRHIYEELEKLLKSLCEEVEE